MLPLFFFLLIFTGCPRNAEDAMMLEIYHNLHAEIDRAVTGTDISAAYLAALITLESHPAGNKNSYRFEPHVYERLREVKYNHKAWGSITAGNLRGYDDDELRAMSASYGLTQIMGYHCVWLGCSVADLKGEYHLQWAVAWMIRHYGTEARAGKWAECFRIHNTGRPDGRTSRADYVQRGLVRMQYYQEWAQKEGRL